MKPQTCMSNAHIVRLFFSFLGFIILSAHSYGQINMSNTTVNTCFDLIYDDGGPSGDYTETNYEMTVCAASGTELYFVLQMLQLGTAFNGDSDILIIYEGTGTGGAVLFDSEVDPAPTGIIMSNDPCITITIDTDPHFFDTDPGAGFELLVSCTVPETCSDGILNNGEVQIDCGGPNCDPCYTVTECGPEVVVNGDFEMSTVVCGAAAGTGFGVNNQIPRPWYDQTPVDSWFGTAIRIDDVISYPSPDYFNTGCTNSGAVPCMDGNGSIGFFVHFGGGQSAEYIQQQLSSPLEAGEEYCVQVKASTRRGGSSNDPPTDKLGFWFHNNTYSNGSGFAEWNNDNGGVPFMGPGTLVNGTPQVVNPPGQMITEDCQDYIYSFCATGGEDHLMVGNFTPGASASGDSEYVSIDNLTVKKSCPLDFDSDIITVGTPDCVGSCIDLVVQTSNQTGGCEVTNDFDFQWYENGVLMPGETDDTLLSVCPNGSVTYSVEITYSAGCRTYTKPAVETSISFCGAFSIIVDALPPSICEGECTDLSVVPSPAGIYTYSWTEQGDPTVIGNTDVLNVCPTITTTYEVEVSDGTNTVVGFVEVVVNSPAVIDAGPDVSICDGGSTDLTATGGVSYTWDNGIGAGAGPHTVSPSVTTIYTVTGVDANGCEGTAQVTVTVDGTGANLTVTGIDVSCFGDTDGSATVVATGTGPFTFDWQPTGGTSDVASGLSPGTYTIEVTDGNGCVSNETIDIDEPAELTLATSSTDSDCTIDNGTATATPSGGTGTYTYDWSPGGQTTATANNLGAGSYDVIVTDDNGCQSTANVIVGNVNGPSITVDNVTNISCSGETDGSANISVAGGTPGYTYDWQPVGGMSDNATDLDAGSYTVTVTDAAGCIATEVIVITSPDAIDIDATVTDSDCGLSNGSIALTVSGGTGGYTYVWNPAGTGATINNLGEGSYGVTVTDANGCEVSANYQIEVIGGLDVLIQPNPSVIESGDEVDLTVTVTTGITGGTYTWTPSDGLSCNDCPDPTASPSETTTYIVTVVSDDGCVGSDSVIIYVVNPCVGAFLPNMFSPNGDGNNDHLCVISECVSTMDLSIYNRWGERVFQSSSPEDCWDGTHRNQPVNTGVFVYKLNVVLTDGEEINETGNITVVR